MANVDRKPVVNVALIGLRGVPANYSGVEVAVEEIASRLAAQGHSMTVYCMSGRYEDRPRKYKGINLRYIPTISKKNLEMIIYVNISSFFASFGNFDIIHYHAIGPSTTALIPRLIGKKIVATVHGLDWQRAKWSFFARTYLRFGEWASARFPHATIVVSKSLRKHFRRKFKKNVHYIPNGAVPKERVPMSVDALKMGLVEKKYLLFVGRITREKGIDILIRAFARLDTEMKLVIVGGSSHTDDYVDELTSLAGSDNRIILAGPIYGEMLEEIFSNAFLFVLPSYLEGLPIVLLEALSYGLPVLVSDIPENLEVIEHRDQQIGYAFKTGDVEDLYLSLRRLLSNPSELQGIRARAAELISEKYNWDSIAAETLSLYQSCVDEP